MSTTPNPLNTVSEDDFYAYLRGEAKKALDEERRAAAAADANRGVTPVLSAVEPDTPEPVKLKIFGQDREFKDVGEVSGAIEKLVNEYQAVVARAAQAPPVVEPTTEEPKVDLDEFVNRIQKDPSDAIDFAFKSKYGVGMEYLLNQARRTEEIEGALVAIQFKEMNEDYQANPANTQILNGIRGNLGLPFSVQGLNAAYAVGKQYGYFQPTGAQGNRAPSLPPPPPSINFNRGGSTPSQSEDLISMVENMSADKAAEFVNRMFQR